MPSTSPPAGRDPAPPAPLSALLAGAAGAALLAVTLALASTAAARPGGLVDPGAVVRWGLPLATLLVRAAATLTVGAFTAAAVVLRGPGRGKSRATASPAWRAAVRVGTGAALVWVVAQAAYLILGYADVWGRPLGAPSFGDELLVFLTRTELGVTWLWAALLAVAVSLAAALTTGATGALWTAGLGAVALVPVALGGHAQGAVGHSVAVSSLWLHLVALAVWLGGLATLVGVSRRLGGELGAAAGRYSAAAGWCFAVVGLSGAFAAALRLQSPLQLVAHPYGRVLLAKILLFLLLGAAGWLHRRRTIPRLGERPALFWRLAGVEVLVMGAVLGLAVALGSSAPPQPQAPLVDPSPVFQLTRYPEPPFPTVASWFTQWHPDPLYLIGAASAVVVYLRWAGRLRRRGDSWPAGRTAAWLLAWALFIWVTNGGPYVYGVVLFSAHMVMHMLLVMFIPILWALAAPVTLALRGLPPRRDGSRGPREWMLTLLHSRWARFWSQPVVAAVNFSGSLFVFYYTGLFELALTTHVGHVLMVLHFSLAGYLFANVIIGVDPDGARPGYPVRLVLLFATMAFHAFFGLSLITQENLLAAGYYGHLGLSWWVDALADQRLGGNVTWAIGETPTLVLAIIMAVLWSRADERAAVRLDRQADRDNDAALQAYNRMLAERAAGRD